ncbi:ion transporter [Litchfieldella xinjiangensis]|uniref:ion transporter n=1 Tax=Litchfieldella xinjiangensis TaxID=1166948 RepID=UPI0005BDA8E5|nr:ion transporter [Halomonas xinjiangensis]
MSPSPRTPNSRLERLHVAWDLFIIALVIINLSLLLFDSLFLVPPLNSAFEAVAPGLHGFYDQQIHANFLRIDLAFVAIFLFDVLLGWAVAIAERRYHRWFFYPFVHWYDVLGCIPLSGFRLLRVLRVVTLLYRLQRLGLIDVKRWYIAGFVAKYYDILLEELSDRIALRMLSTAQDQVRSSESLSRRLVDDVIMPRKQQLMREITGRIEEMAGNAYARNQGDLMRYVSALVGRTLAESREIQRLKRLPMGGQVASALDDTLSDIACRLVHEAVEGLRSPEFNTLLERVTDSGFDAWLQVDNRTDRITEHVLVDMLEVVKEQVARQNWKKKYAAPDR